GHLEAAVAVDGPYGLVGPRDLGSHRGGNAETHRAETAGVDPRRRALIGDEVRRPHLVLADTGHVRGLGPGDLADALDDLLRSELVVVGLVVPERIAIRNAVQHRHPGGEVAAAAVVVLGLQRHHPVGYGLATV